MTTTIRARFDGKVLHPLEPLDLRPDTEVVIKIELEENGAGEGDSSFLDTALSLNIEGPVDWSTRVDEILYGHPGHCEE